MKERTYFSWSSGKDATLALYYLKRSPQLTIDKLLTSVNSHHNRVSMHGLRRSLLEEQARSVGIPLEFLELPEQPTMEDYNIKMEETLKKLQLEGYVNGGFGDIFLEDLKVFRERQLEPYKIKGLFPLWKLNTRELLEEFIGLGFKAITICIKSDLLDRSFLGRTIDPDFIADLPKNVDPCGENGEFHTFCYDGPIFRYPIRFSVGEQVYREYKNPDYSEDNSDQNPEMGFWFCDLLPTS